MSKKQSYFRFSKTISLIALVAPVLLPLPALAAGGGPAPISTLFWPVVCFTIYAVIIRYIYVKVGRPALKERKRAFSEMLHASAAKLAEANQSLEDAKARYLELEEEKTMIVAQLREQGKKMAEIVLADAERQAAQIARDSERDLDSRVKTAQAALRKEALANAAEMARERLLSELSAEDDKRLRREAIEQLARG